MKRFITAAALVVFAMNFSYGQYGDFRFGFQASPIFSWMSTDESHIHTNGSFLGFRLGAVGEYYFGENYAFTGGLGFAFNTGGRLLHDKPGTYWSEALNGEQLPRDINLKYNLQYVEIPFGLKMRTKEFGYMRYFAEIPMFTIGFSSQSRGTVENETLGLDEDLNIDDEINAIALSWGFGGGVEYNLSSSTALVGGLYYSTNFTDITDDNGDYFNAETLEKEGKNDEKSIIRSITIRLGILF